MSVMSGETRTSGERVEMIPKDTDITVIAVFTTTSDIIPDELRKKFAEVHPEYAGNELMFLDFLVREEHVLKKDVVWERT